MRGWLAIVVAGSSLLLLRCGSDDLADAPSADAGADTMTEPDTGDAADAGSTCGRSPTDAVPIVASADKDEDPCLLRAKDGTIYLTWFSARGGKNDLYVKSSADGCVWSDERAITNDDVADFYPTMIQTTDGTFHLVWWRGDVGDGGIEGIVGSIWTMHSTDTITWSTPFALTDKSALAWTPTMAERTPGELYVTWSSNAHGDKDIYVTSSHDNGNTWDPTPVRITDDTHNDDIPVIVSKNEKLTILYQRYDTAALTFGAAFGEVSNELVTTTSLDGGAWTPPVLLTNDPPATKIPDFPSSDATGWSAAWASFRTPGSAASHIYAMGLGLAPATSENTKALTVAGGYSPRLLPTATAGIYLMVWVADAGADGSANPDIFMRFVAP